MKPVTETKRRALLDYKAAPVHGTLQCLRKARNTARKTARFCANTYWVELCKIIQSATNQGDIKTHALSLHWTYNFKVSSTQVKNIRDDEKRDKQMQCWTELSLELYATQNVVSDSALEKIPDLPVLDQLYSPPPKRKLVSQLII